jgi:hypothetical protein
MKHWHRILILTSLISLVAASFAMAALDSPSLDAGVSGHAKQRITITAGATGAPNGFTVRWMDQSTYYANGGQFPATPSIDESNAAFTGEPTLNTFGGQYTTFKLGPNESIQIEIGDLGDESGVAGTRAELASGSKFYYAAFANDANGNPDSDLSLVVSGTTTESTNCTYTQGYWKNHPNAWPVLSLTLGTVNYTKAELLAILGTEVGGNGLISLAHQLIAAKLNIAQGADPSAASAAIAAADALIGGLVVPPIGGGYLDPADTSALTQILDDYNNGVIGPGHCGTVATQPSTWGQVKALYR